MFTKGFAAMHLSIIPEPVFVVFLSGQKFITLKGDTP
jgi:hypothetical protein